MKVRKLLCLKCLKPVSKVTDKDYPKSDYYYCNTLDCDRCGLLTVLFQTKEGKELK